MLRGAKKLIGRLERFLRITDECSNSVRVRSRIVYGAGIVALLVHALNMVSLAIVYGEWTSQHSVSVFALIYIAAVTLSVRYTKSAVFSGTAYAVLSVGAIGLAAAISPVSGVPPHGINTALIPLLCSSAMLVAFISTRWVSILNILASLCLIGFLYAITARQGLTGVDAALSWQRAVQAWAGILMAGPISTFIAYVVYRNLDVLEIALGRARQAEKDRSDFLATMSHEIRTPLHGILGLSDMLSRADLPSPQKRQAELVTVSANNLMEIIDEVLDMARLEDGTVTIKAEPLSVSKMLNDISELFAVKASQKNLWIGTDIDPGLPAQLIGDAPHLRQVVSNLVGNALKFTQEGGVRVGARYAGHKDDQIAVQFYVQDSGVGIASEDQVSVFERFKQTDSAKTSKTKGTGLGLSICQELTDMMGTTLELHSEPGQGTVFHFTLLMPQVEKQSAQNEEAA